ncbi:MAG: MazF family transcriptional regulator [Bacteroidetes bacterium]|nr:MazF family transcriptional regulator [Bacteroidota bacterium]
MAVYKQGDIVLAQFPFTDLVGSKLRPALIISCDKLNATGDYICMQITSKQFNDDCFFEIKGTDVVTPLKLRSGIRLQKIFTIHSTIVQYKISSVTSLVFSEIIETMNVKVIALI